MAIRLLDPITITKIAAGEVIDRPASVVKELLENSLDAGATSVVIEVEEGGKKRICISDNGQGISKQDMPLAPVAHATSKIESLDDIYSQLSYGFRGEALASISHVAHLTIQSRTADQEVGFKLRAFQGKIGELEPVSCTVGTVVEVWDLFAQIPVREKFLRSDATELSYIYDVVLQAALCYPQFAFILRHKGQDLLNTSGLDSLMNVVRMVFGKEWLSHLIPIQASTEGVSLRGLVSSPALTFANRTKQWVSVNGRPIKNAVIQRAVQQVFRDRIPSGRFPFLVLDIGLSPELVDVNIHPQKQDVKFLKPGMMFDALPQALALALEDHPGTPTTYVTLQPRPHGDGGATADRLNLAGSITHEQVSEAIGLFSPGVFDSLQDQPIPYLHIYNTYIVVKTSLGLAILDQHAVHERILYDRFKARYAQKNDLSQPLLISEVVHLDPVQFELIESVRSSFGALGFEWEPFGTSDIIVRAVPAELTDISITSVIQDLIGQLQAVPGSELKVALPIEKLQMMSCKAAIKAGKTMSELEVHHLLQDLVRTPSQFTCPHGRPLCLFFGKPELEKLFLRR